MSRLFMLFAIAGMLICPRAGAQDYSNAATYMQYFSDQCRQVSKDMWDYMSVIARAKNARKIDNRRKDLLNTLLETQKKVANAKPYKGDKGLRDSTVAYLALNYSVLNDDYKLLAELEEVAEQSVDNMSLYMMVRKRANDKMNRASESLDLEQRRFAAEHNLNLIDDETKLGKKLDRAGKAFDYYDNIFLIFFKSQVHESSMIDAQNAGDLQAMEQGRMNLKVNSAECLKELSEIDTYLGDASLLLACKSLLNFYKKEAEEKASTIIDFFQKKEKFESHKASMEFKGNSVTREEIESYNATLKEYNAAVVKVNAVNNELNKERSMKISVWNEAVRVFLDKHAS